MNQNQRLEELEKRIDAILDAETGDFIELLEAAGLNPLTDLSYADLRDLDLSGVNLQNADLVGVDLSNADLRFANLSHANLHDAKLDRADLTGANLHHADVTGASCENAILAHADLEGTPWAGRSEGAAGPSEYWRMPAEGGRLTESDSSS